MQKSKKVVQKSIKGVVNLHIEMKEAPVLVAGR